MPPSAKSDEARAAHPSDPALVGDLDLSSAALSGRGDASKIAAFAKMLANAEYWISFDLASFEPTLARCPSPLRELGVAVLLKYGEDVGGTLGEDDLARAREGLRADLPADLWRGVEMGLDSLTRAVLARDRAPGLVADGFCRARRDAGVAAHALRAMGSAVVSIEGVPDREKSVELELGAAVLLSAADERGRPLTPPEVESRLGAEVLVRDDDEARTRSVVFLVPGRYQIRVPNKATGERKVLVR